MVEVEISKKASDFERGPSIRASFCPRTQNVYAEGVGGVEAGVEGEEEEAAAGEEESEVVDGDGGDGGDEDEDEDEEEDEEEEEEEEEEDELLAPVLASVLALSSVLASKGESGE